MNEPTLKDKAEYFRQGLHRGLLRVEEAMAWIDAELVREPEPPLALVDAALSGRQGWHVVADALGEVEGEANKEVVVRLLLARMAALLDEDASQALTIAHWLFLLVFTESVPDTLEDQLMWTLEDDLLLASQEGTARVVGQMRVLLQQYV